IGAFDPDPVTGGYRGMAAFAEVLGVDYAGWYPVAGYEVFTSASDHPIASRAGVAPPARLTQGISEGTDIFDLTSNALGTSPVLLEVASPDGQSYFPFLVVAEPPTGGRAIAMGSYAGFVGAAAPFRAKGDDGFFDNQLLPYLIESTLWLLHDAAGPFPGLQLSNAPMTVVGRLDGDWSGEREETIITLGYLNAMGRATGVATVYGIVSADAPEAGWDAFADGGRQLEALGGSIGSHSHNH